MTNLFSDFRRLVVAVLLDQNVGEIHQGLRIGRVKDHRLSQRVDGVSGRVRTIMSDSRGSTI